MKENERLRWQSIKKKSHLLASNITVVIDIMEIASGVEIDRQL